MPLTILKETLPPKTGPGLGFAGAGVGGKGEEHLPPWRRPLLAPASLPHTLGYWSPASTFLESRQEKRRRMSELALSKLSSRVDKVRGPATRPAFCPAICVQSGPPSSATSLLFHPLSIRRRCGCLSSVSESPPRNHVLVPLPPRPLAPQLPELASEFFSKTEESP